MIDPPADLYSASFNPPRKAKRPLPASASASAPPASAAAAEPLPISSQKSTVKQTFPPCEDEPAPTPAKRGRKPGPLSRAAREAQRRLNHSIIEKARRTKINDALATLRELVPLESGQPKTPILGAVESEPEDDGDEYQPTSNKPNKPGKKQEKEKEFKLEILIRTVSYMKDLIKRVEELEARVGESSNAEPSSRKRRLDLDDAEGPPPPNRPRRDSHVRTTQESNEQFPLPSKFHSSLEGPLPSISSWLPETAIDPRLLPPKDGPSTKDGSSYLPSPPLSTHFDPVRTSYHPPKLSLGSAGHSAMSSTVPVRTAEDETAATLLIHMSTSPAFRPASQTSQSPFQSSPRFVGGGPSLADPSRMSLSPGSSRSSSPVLSMPSSPSAYDRVQAQTPASLLGLTHLLRS